MSPSCCLIQSCIIHSQSARLWLCILFCCSTLLALQSEGEESIPGYSGLSLAANATTQGFSALSLVRWKTAVLTIMFELSCDFSLWSGLKSSGLTLCTIFFEQTFVQDLFTWTCCISAASVSCCSRRSFKPLYFQSQLKDLPKVLTYMWMSAAGAMLLLSGMQRIPREPLAMGRTH